MSKNLYWYLANLERGLDLSPEESLNNLYKILKVNEISKGERAKGFYEFERMLHSANIGYIKGNENIVFEIYKCIIEMTEKQVFEYVCYMLSSEKYRFGAMIPETLSKIMFLNIGKADTLLIADAEKFGFGLYDIVKCNRNKKFYFTIKNIVILDLYKFIFKDCNVEFIDSDICEPEFTTKKFDLILAFPPMGGRTLESKDGFFSRDPSFIAAQNLLYHLTSEGKLQIILPAKIGFGSGDAEDLRRYIEGYYKVCEIASLPARVFYPYMSINTYLITISNGDTDSVNMIKYKLEKEELFIEDDRLVFSDELISLNSWNVDMAFSMMNETIMDYKNSNIKKATLKDVADVFRGKAINTKVENGNVAVVNISNISETGIDYDSLETIDEEERKVSRYLLQEGDVLIATKGFAVKVAVVEKQNRMIIPSSNLCVIRPKQKMLNGTYLKLFLESETGMKLIKALQRGTTVVNINYQDICELEVPTPSLNEQNEIANQYIEGLRIYKKIIEEAEYAWSMVKQDVMKKLF